MPNLDKFFEWAGTFPPIPKRKRHKTPKKNLEAAVLKECLVWLKQQGYYAERRNTGAIDVGRTVLQFGSPGAADIFAVVHGRHVEIECKRRDGQGRTSAAQKAFAWQMREHRIPYVIVTSAMELEAWVGKLLLSWTR